MLLGDPLRKDHQTDLLSVTESPEDFRDPFLHLIRSLLHTLSTSIPAIAEAEK